MRGNKGFVLIAGCVCECVCKRECVCTCVAGCSTCHWQRLVNDVCTMTAIRWIFPYRHTSLGMFDTFQKRVFFRFYQSQFQKVCLTFNLNFFFSLSLSFLSDVFIYLSIFEKCCCCCSGNVKFGRFYQTPVITLVSFFRSR